jgi:hypothetical protein
MGKEDTSDCTCKFKVAEESTFVCSTDRGKAELAQSFGSSGMICNTGDVSSPSAIDGTEDKADNGEELSSTRGEKQPYSSAPLSSVELAPTSPGGQEVGEVFNKAGTRESLLKVASARSRKLSTRSR